jgi:hypothetical protein
MSGRALLNPTAAEHLVKLLGLLGSHHDGEVAAAGRKAHEHLKRFGLTWHDVISVPPGWQRMAKTCREHLDLLSEREVDFIINISRARRPPTDKQLEWLAAIFERLQEQEGAA